MATAINNLAGNDKVEAKLRSADEATKDKTGMGLFHWMTIASIGASIALFASGKKQLAIFIGLWPPTIQALRSK